MFLREENEKYQGLRELTGGEALLTVWGICGILF
jgi:hypothetical protein